MKELHAIACEYMRILITHFILFLFLQLALTISENTYTSPFAVTDQLTSELIIGNGFTNLHTVICQVPLGDFQG